MFKLLKSVFKTGDVTVKYPFKPLEVHPDLRGKPEFNSDQCIVCSACTIACPANALTMRTDPVTGDRTWSLFLARCIFCGRCEEVCPTKAIRLTPDFELAVINKNDLLQETVFPTICCSHCHQPFTSYKEFNYTLALLKQAGLNDEQIEHQRAVLSCCPECRRQLSLNRTGEMGKVMGMSLATYQQEDRT
ncbi:formate hydrogenlyase complex iron-sulfur subunit [Bisgaard Taxon 45]|uniref:Formate hydrogenlyase complex iron-sulfur subunit n=1 Tax=Bisgaard Taxon 45 TaxID=304289 RepID=A0ABT9KFI5_9PAST|nr:formate hydrogenlyase complex iron-sulfur subunit [Bisgaard Taxon 45]